MRFAKRERSFKYGWPSQRDYDLMQRDGCSDDFVSTISAKAQFRSFSTESADSRSPSPVAPFPESGNRRAKAAGRGCAVMTLPHVFQSRPRTAGELSRRGENPSP